MSISSFKLAEFFCVGNLAAVARFHPQVVMKHFMVNDSCYDIFRDVAPVQHRIKADNFGSVGIAGQLNGALLPHPPSGSPGNLAVYFVCKVFVIDLIKKFLEMEVSSRVAQYSSPRPGRGFSDFAGVGRDKISEYRIRFSITALDKANQRAQNLCIRLEEHVMQPYSVTVIRWPDVDHRVGVVRDCEVYGSFNQPGQGRFEV